MPTAVCTREGCDPISALQVRQAGAVAPPNLEWAHITSPGIGAEFAPEHFRPPPLPRGTSDAHPCRAAV